MGILSWFNRKVCLHHKYAKSDRFSRVIGYDSSKYKVESCKILGVTLGWSGRPEPVYRWDCECFICGGKFYRQGLLSRAWQFDVKRDENDWPLNEDGTKMEIYDHDE